MTGQRLLVDELEYDKENDQGFARPDWRDSGLETDPARPRTRYRPRGQYCSARNVLGSAPAELARRSASFFTNATRAHRRHLRARSVERKILH